MFKTRVCFFSIFSEYNKICLDGLDLCENDKEFLGVSWFWMFSESNENCDKFETLIDD